MNKKKTNLIAVISVGLVIVLGICFMIFWGQDRSDKRDEAQCVTATEPSAEPVTEPTVEASIEPTMEPEEENQEMRSSWNAHRNPHRFFTMKTERYTAINLFSGA